MRTPALLCLLALTTVAFAQKKKLPAQPKLIVGITVDQMRYDFLYRYTEKYTSGGFRRLLNEGFSCKYTHYDYIPTNTAPGHAAIFTGSVPSVHGIAGNEWYDRATGREVYCTDDSTVVASDGSGSKAGKMSPRNLLASTITDQFKIATNFQGKVIGISLKDRGAIIPAGHAADAAYWFDSRDGSWISSTYYPKSYPDWVRAFNARKLANDYLAKPWNTLLPIEQYTESNGDDLPYELPIPGTQKPTFPHEVAGTFRDFYENFRKTPFGNSLTKDFALAAIQNENLGKGTSPDFLTVSFSSTDYIGHSFGPNSIEIQDTYLRLDRDIAELLTFLDTWVGKENVLVFLSADHGVNDIWQFSKDHGIPAGSLGNTRTTVDSFMDKNYFPADWTVHYNNYQLYLNHKLLDSAKIDFNQIFPKLRTEILKKPGIANVVNLHQLGQLPVNAQYAEFIRNGFNAKRGGDLLVLPEPAWLDGYTRTGTGHGTSYAYDTHVPCIFYGWKVPKGSTVEPTKVVDIAPTIAQLLDILEPNGTTGQPVKALFEKIKQ